MTTELQKAVAKLVEREPGWKAFLKPADVPPAIGPSVGVGKPKGSGAGGAGDLTEISFADRTYYPDKYLKSSDGLFQWQAIKTAKFRDAAGGIVTITFAAPA